MKTVKAPKAPKEPKEIITLLPISDLIEGGVYFSSNKELVQIKKINHEKQEMDTFNLSEQVNYFGISINRHSFVKRVR